MNTQLTLADISVFNGEPTILDLRLAEILGYERDRNIRKLIERNLIELQMYGEVCSTVEQTSPDGGRPGTAYHLNEAQALLISTLSKTENAARVRHMLITVFIEWRNGTLLSRRAAPPDAFEIDIEHAPLSAKVDFLKVVARFRGREAAVAMMPQIGLPDIDLILSGARVSSDGGAECLAHLLAWRDGEGATVAALLDAVSAGNRDMQKRLTKLGVRAVLVGEPGILVASNIRPIREIFDGTRWSNGRHVAALRGLDGVTASNPTSFDGYQSRTLFIPARWLSTDPVPGAA